MSVELNDSDHDGNAKASKLGRKGDPRMHTAVAARLANPDITLFEALQIGGFNYPTNDDASTVDTEKVTLGQRKNQLSRRLRLARKQQQGSSPGGENGNELAGEHSGTPSTDDENQRSVLTESCSLVRQQQLSSMKGDNVAAASISQVRPDLKADTQRQPQRPGNKLGARALAMKREVDFCLDGDDFLTAPSSATQEEPPKRQCMAKFHPDFAPILVHPARFGGRSSYRENGSRSVAGGVFAAAMEHNQHHQPPCTSPGMTSEAAAPINGMTSAGLSSSGPMMSSNIASGFSPSQYYDPHFAPYFPGQQHQVHQPPPRASAVAVSSLNSSAQSVGLTLEQLALALSSNTRNLAKLVAETRSGKSMAKQQELALNLHETEAKALYTRCMLMAGIDVGLAQPGTPTYTSFALKAWQAEGERLQGLVRTIHRDRAHSDLSVDETEARNKSGPDGNDYELNSQVGNGLNHDHSHDRNDDDHADAAEDDEADDQASGKCDAQHIHRLGQCGHKAIIHHPKDGAAHIDFIVNDRVECYMGLESLPLGRSVDSAWPSKYKCKDMEETCSKTCGKSMLNSGDVNWSSAESVGTEPKIFKLTDINLQDPEWNYDPSGSVDGGVMGLFQLGGDNSS